MTRSNGFQQRPSVWPRQLVILDVDGTLVHSLEAEALLFPRACEEALNLKDVSSDWETYRCPSDSGIVRELVEERLGRPVTRDDYLQVEQAFLALIRDAYRSQPGLCRPVSGAMEALDRFRQMPDLALTIATGGWHLTATHKMAVAGLSVEDLPIATSHDAEEKIDIMRAAADRAAGHYGVERFAGVVCFGDSMGDARAASELGYEFVAIDTSGCLAESEYCYSDFTDLDEIVRTMSTLLIPTR